MRKIDRSVLKKLAMLMGLRNLRNPLLMGLLGINIDGDQVSNITIDGQQVQEVTLDGKKVWEYFSYPAEVDNFNRSSLNYYSGDTSNFFTSSKWVYEGSNSLRSDAEDSQYMYSFPGDGLNYYPERGDKIRYVTTYNNLSSRDGWENPLTKFKFGSPDTEKSYDVRIIFEAGDATSNKPGAYLDRIDSGNHKNKSKVLASKTSTSINEKENLYVEIDFQDTITVNVWKNDWGGSTWASISATDTNYNGRGIGFFFRTASSGVDCEKYIDNIHVVE